MSRARGGANGGWITRGGDDGGGQLVNARGCKLRLRGRVLMLIRVLMMLGGKMG